MDDLRCSPELFSSTGDEGVMATNDSASVCKRSCVSLGYFEDPFVECFSRGHLERKPPEINRGYYARVATVTHLVQQFIESCVRSKKQVQIINIGAGFDTLYWRLKSLYKVTNLNSFVEIDLPGVTARKVLSIRRKSKLLEYLGEDIKCNSSELHSNCYHLISFDLRTISTSANAPNEFKNKLITQCGMDVNLPTIILSECVLVYLDNSSSSSVLRWLTDTFKAIFLINYEQVNLDDKFGEVMLENLHSMHADLLGLENCKSLKSQEGRLISNGFSNAAAWDMSSIYHKFLPRAEIERIEKIEFLDEKDLLEQLLNHYCIALASTKELEEQIEFNIKDAIAI